MMNREARSVVPEANLESKRTAKAAIMVSLSESRRGEAELIQSLKAEDIHAAAADFGGPFPEAISRMVEAAVVAAKREGVIRHTHAEEGAVAGACHEALQQLMAKSTGLNVGGKIGIARLSDHLTVSIFVSIGLLHLNDVAIGMAHRYI